MNKHSGFTPGPWLRVDTAIHGNGLKIADTSFGRKCASMKLSLEEHAANLALIADAPALLAERDRLRADLADANAQAIADQRMLIAEGVQLAQERDRLRAALDRLFTLALREMDYRSRNGEVMVQARARAALATKS